MTIGSLGSVVFAVSDRAVNTIKSLSWKTSVSYSAHKMHLKKSLLEYTGDNPDEIEFEANVSAFLGVNPLGMIQQLRRMAAERTIVRFVLGTDVIGSNWVITDLSASADSFFQDGTITSANIKIKIKEYGEE